MGEFAKAIEASSVPPGTMIPVDTGGNEILIANVDGEYFAMCAICKHEQWDLSEGSLDDAKVTCAGHGAIWNLKSGKAAFVEPLEDEPIYEVKVEQGFVYVKVR